MQTGEERSRWCGARLFRNTLLRPPAPTGCAAAFLGICCPPWLPILCPASRVCKERPAPGPAAAHVTSLCPSPPLPCSSLRPGPPRHRASRPGERAAVRRAQRARRGQAQPVTGLPPPPRSGCGVLNAQGPGPSQASGDSAPPLSGRSRQPALPPPGRVSGLRQPESGHRLSAPRFSAGAAGRLAFLLVSRGAGLVSALRATSPALSSRVGPGTLSASRWPAFRRLQESRRGPRPT